MEHLLENKDITVAILGVLSTVVGLFTAVVNRKKIIENRTVTIDSSSGDSVPGPARPGSLRRRLKKFLLCVVLSVVGLFVLGACVDGANEDFARVAVWPVLIVMIMAMYHLTALALIISWRTLRFLAGT
jgi:hypothetical protein